MLMGSCVIFFDASRIIPPRLENAFPRVSPRKHLCVTPPSFLFLRFAITLFPLPPFLDHAPFTKMGARPLAFWDIRLCLLFFCQFLSSSWPGNIWFRYKERCRSFSWSLSPASAFIPKDYFRLLMDPGGPCSPSFFF